ncbi:MAG: hypothetical protein J6U00_13010 [Ruminococcus sp.]|uniref:hypothetical protein n=1 Tax=Ruminococcus sp. TaxID=41978 RepID=UPI001B0A1812|nr:hypothetical protein [Ruminococcus sp.]MBO7474892.1 hypothetical protein [Ruminococcus sp.]
MNNELDPNKIKGLLNVISKKIGVPPEKLRSELEEGKFDTALSAMNKNDALRFKQAVNNPKIVEKMMSSPQAKALYEKLTGGKKM